MPCVGVSRPTQVKLNVLGHIEAKNYYETLASHLNVHVTNMTDSGAYS